MEYGLVALWLLTYLVVGLAALPLAAVLFERFPDRGAGLAIPFGVAIVTVVALWVGHVAFVWPALAAGLVVLAAGTVAADRLGDAEPNWRLAGETAAVFAVAFFFLVAVRAVDPAVHPVGGEKFLDFGIVKSLYRSSTLPPEDFWFAGEPLAYYYGGHLVTTLFGTLAGTAPQYAYNLSLAGFYAMAVTAAFGLGSTFAAARDAPRRLGGVAAAFFVGFASNLQTAGRLLLWALPEPISGPLTEAIARNTGKEIAKLTLSPDQFHYWAASRVIPGTINEFPLFGFLNGDLHGHMTVTPFSLLLIGILAAYYRTPEELLTRRRLLALVLAPAVGGLISFTNTWSAASVLGLTALALLFAPASPQTLLPSTLSERLTSVGAGSQVGEEVVRIVTAGVLAAVVEALAMLWVAPFTFGSASTRSLAFFPDRSSLGGLLLVHGAFVVVSALYLVSRTDLSRNQWTQVAIAVGGLLAISVVLTVPAVGLFVPFLAVGWLFLRTDRDVGFETVLLLAATGLILMVEFVYVEELAGPGRFNTVFKMYSEVWIFWSVAAGTMLSAVVARYRPTPDAATTSANTTVSAQADGGDDPRRRQVSTGASGGRSGSYRRAALAGFLVVLLASTSVYGTLALGKHFSGNSLSQYQTVDDPTLNATQFVETGHPNEAPAIRWIDSLDGQPNFVTAPGFYWWRTAAWHQSASNGQGASAPASLTGVPTVMGWPHHEKGFREPGPVEERARDVRAIYTGAPADQVRLLKKYDVQYIYVGPAERAEYGGPEGITVDELDGVTVAKQWAEVTIYEVDQSALSASTNASA